jgi:hypothetical protein
MIDRRIFDFHHHDGRTFCGTQKEFYRHFELRQTGVNGLVNGKISHFRGWKVDNIKLKQKTADNTATNFDIGGEKTEYTGHGGDNIGNIHVSNVNGRNHKSVRDRNGRWTEGNRTGGRPPGAKNKRSLEIAAEIARLGIDPLLFLAKVAADPQAELPHRISAASAVLPYLHPRARTQRLIVKTFELARPADAAEAATQISMINARVAAGQLDIEDAACLIKGIQAWAQIYVSMDLENVVRNIVTEMRAEPPPSPSRPNLVAIGR